ncbi:MAG: SDR family oxidoreductase [Acidimicrobiia bacterium]|nr:SDR family oxidoreductase [Acidimicrobiia bacterium]
MHVQDQLVFVTGGGSGIGEALCRRFAAEGAATVIVTDLSGEQAERVAADTGGIGRQLDVGDEAAVTSTIASIENDHGPLGLLVNNAGIATGGSVDVPTALWQKAWDINVMAHVYAIRAALPGMLANGSGYILSTVSAAGLLTNIGAAPYAVTKHAALALAEWVSMTYGKQGIGVSALCPQFVETPMLDLFGDAASQEWVRSIAISTADVADAVIEGLAAERFLILPHPEVETFFQNKANDYDRWLGGMRKLNEQLSNPDFG